MQWYYSNRCHLKHLQMFWSYQRDPLIITYIMFMITHSHFHPTTGKLQLLCALIN